MVAVSPSLIQWLCTLFHRWVYLCIWKVHLVLLPVHFQKPLLESRCWREFACDSFARTVATCGLQVADGGKFPREALAQAKKSSTWSPRLPFCTIRKVTSYLGSLKFWPFIFNYPLLLSSLIRQIFNLNALSSTRHVSPSTSFCWCSVK